MRDGDPGGGGGGCCHVTAVKKGHENGQDLTRLQCLSENYQHDCARSAMECHRPGSS